MRLADLNLSSRDGVVVASVTGEIDMSNASQLAEAITTAVPNESLGIALDLSEVDYLDSAGIHLIYRLRESLRTRGQLLRLVVADGSPVTDALRLAGVTGQVEIVATVDDAVRPLRP